MADPQVAGTRVLPAPPPRPSMAGAPRQHRAATMFQRKRSVSFGGYGWWVPFLPIPPWLRGARCHARSSASLGLRRGALAAEPPRCPTPTGAGGSLGPPCPWGRGCSCAPAKPLASPAGAKQRGDLPGGSWWALVGTSPARASCGFPPPRPPTPFSLPAPVPEQRCSQPPPAPCGEVPPGPWQVPGAIGTFPTRPCSVCPRQSTAAAPRTPASAGPFASRVPSLRDGLFYREIVQKKVPVLPLPFPLSKVFYARSESVLRDCDQAVGTGGRVGNFTMVLAVGQWVAGCPPLPGRRWLGAPGGSAGAGGLGAACNARGECRVTGGWWEGSELVGGFGEVPWNRSRCLTEAECFALAGGVFFCLYIKMGRKRSDKLLCKAVL